MMKPVSSSTLLGGNAALILAVIAGAVVMIRPDFMDSHQNLMGVIISSGGLFGLVFWNADRSLGIQGVMQRNRLSIGTITLLSGFSVALAFVWEYPDLEGVGMMGIITLVTTLIAARAFDPQPNMSHHHVRIAISVSAIATFYGLIAVTGDDVLPRDSLLAQTLDQFWKILVAVIGFYFGGVTLEAFGKNLGNKNAEPPEEPVIERRLGRESSD